METQPIVYEENERVYLLTKEGNYNAFAVHSTDGDAGKPKVYIVPLHYDNGDVLAMGISEDGYNLGSHLCSNEAFGRFDMARPHHRKAYEHHYPDGYQLVFLTTV